MIDYELQARFWRNATDALLHSVEASLAGLSAWQDQALSVDTTVGLHAKAPLQSITTWPWIAGPTTNPQAMNPWQIWWLPASPARPVLPSTPAMMMPETMTSMMMAMMPWAGAFWQTATILGPQSPMIQMTKAMTPYWPWPEMTWAYMQMPLTAMLMSSGLPYAVASPSAKASTAAMDAAHAARAQMDKVYSTYRSEGGHAAAQFAVLPWTLAASFIEGSSKPAT